MRNCQIFLNIVDDFVPDPVDGPFENWISQYQSTIIARTGDLGALLAAADPDGDGFTNLEELVFNLDPTLDSRPGIGNDPNSGNVPFHQRAVSQRPVSRTAPRGNPGAFLCLPGNFP